MNRLTIAIYCVPLLLIFLNRAAVSKNVTFKKYNPTWKSLDTRPLPSWYDDAKFGIFMHWGVYSVPSFGSEWFWWAWKHDQNPRIMQFMKNNYPPNWKYGDFGNQFTAEFFDPNFWADLLKASGAKYVVLTSKHHEGYTMWPSKYSFNWNAMDVGPHRDLVGELASSLRTRTNVRFGLYHSLYEWFNPLYLQDKANNWATQDFVNSKVIPEMMEVVNAYKPDVLWSDGDWEADYNYWQSQQFIAWLYNESPVKDTVVTNDRWGIGTTCQHGGYYTCADRYNPGTLQPHKWENCMTIDTGSWGFRREAVLSDYLSIESILETLASTVSCGGNLLMNVGPTHDGRIIPIFEERLRQTGEWLQVNGEAIYQTTPWVFQNDTTTPNIWYTSKDFVTYAIVLKWPNNNQLYLGAPVTAGNTVVTMLGDSTPMTWTKGTPAGIVIDFPEYNPLTLPSKWAWVLKLENLF